MPVRTGRHRRTGQWLVSDAARDRGSNWVVSNHLWWASQILGETLDGACRFKRQAIRYAKQMLNRVVILPDGLDLPSLAEALVYYGHVEVLYQNGSLCDLIEHIGIDGALRLAESDLVTFLYDFSVGAILTEDKDFLPYSFWNVYLTADEHGRRINNALDEIVLTAKRRLGAGAIPMSKLRRLAKAIYVRETPSTQVNEATLADIRDTDFLNRAIKLALAEKAPGYPLLTNVRVEAVEDGGKFLIQSNIDFKLANQLSPEAETEGAPHVTYPQLVNPISRMRSEMFFSGDRMCDLWADDLHSKILRERVNSFLNRIEGGRRNIERFEEFSLQGRSFKTAVESGERSILDILDFAELESTRKFKSWIVDQPPRGDLLVEYEKACISESGVTRSLPFKLSKLVLMSAAGTAVDSALGGTGLPGLATGIASSVAVDGLDELLLSRLKIGWRPNQWVSGSALKFLPR